MLGIVESLQGWTNDNLGWIYILLANVFVILALYLILSRYGNIKLGGEEAEPEFSKPAWFAMLFSAGMGSGLIFSGSYEALLHYSWIAEGSLLPEASAQRAMLLSFLNWGFHAWAIYALVGLTIGFFAFNFNLPFSVRSAFYPMLGRRGVSQTSGNVIDISATLACAFGLMTSIAIGVMAIVGGLRSYMPAASSAISSEILGCIIVMIIATISLFSAISGVGQGIKKLSQVNMLLALGMIVFVLFAGNSWSLLRSFGEDVGAYCGGLLELSVTFLKPKASNNEERTWLIGSWAWWLAWSPFVGIFLARISRGRTIREFLLVTIIVPSLFSLFWFAVLGKTTIWQYGHKDLIAALLQYPEMITFSLLGKLPFPEISIIYVVVLLVIFLVTSIDSGVLVLSYLTSGGYIGANLRQKIFWGIVLAGISGILLFRGYTMDVMKATITISALPFAIALFIMCFSLIKGLKRYYLKGNFR